MAAFSLSTVWEETIAFLRREAGLLVPVALALFGSAQILVMLAMGSGMGKPETASPQSLLIFPGLLLMLLGNLAVTRLALIPGTSVGEALSGAIRRLPIALAACLLIALALSAIVTVILVAATFGAMSSGTDIKSAGMTNQLTLLAVIPMIILFVRLMMLMPVLAMEREGVVAAIRRTWHLGRGNAMRFLGVFLLSLALNLGVAIIEMIVLGAVAGLLRLLVGGEIATVLQLLVTGTLGALLMLGLTVYVAMIYRKLAEG
jgi:hypothetical protein